jgi:hypothetical protein
MKLAGKHKANFIFKIGIVLICHARCCNSIKKQAWNGATFELKDATTTNRMA